MRWDCGKRGRVRARKLVEWHPWFAWRPVRVDGRCVWLETVRRKGSYLCGWGGCDWFWEYEN